MYKFTTFIFTLLALGVSLVSAQIPDFPQYLNNTDIYPDTRCKDFCTFLGPRQICPGQWTNPACLCAVYDVRLPAVLPHLAPIKKAYEKVANAIVRTMLGIEEFYNRSRFNCGTGILHTICQCHSFVCFGSCCCHK